MGTASVLLTFAVSLFIKAPAPEQREPVPGPAQAVPAPAKPVVEPVTPGPTEDARRPGSTAIAPPIEVRLENVRWQALPEEIESVALSPDRRVWCLMRQPPGRPELRQSAVRQVVEREFAKPSPQLQGVRCVFFETAGTKRDARSELKRVWMLCGRAPRILLGYDGKQWIERRTKGSMFMERLPASRSFFQLDGGIVILDSFGCHVLQGTNWIYQDFQCNGQRGRNVLSGQRAWPDADGKGLTVVTDFLQPELWRYREGTWRMLPWPKNLQGVSPAKLGEHVYATSPVSLASMSPSQLAYLRRRPRPSLTRIALDGAVETLDPKGTLTVGRYRIPPTHSMYNTLDGMFYAWCEEAYQGAEKLGPGVVICNPLGTACYVPNNGERPPDLQKFTGAQVLLDGGKRAWSGNLLLDMAKLTSIGQLPDANFQVIAAAEDGTVFAQHVVREFGEPPGQIMAFRPAAPDARAVLRGQTVKGAGTGYCIGSDGCIWATFGRGPSDLERFDGESWRAVSDLKIPWDAHAIIPAQNGWILAYVGHRAGDLQIQGGALLNSLFGPQYLLLNGQKCLGDDSFGKWIPQDRERFLEAFSQPSPHRPWYAFRPLIARREQGRVVINRELEFAGAGVVVDKGKNIWTNSLGAVSVVTADRVLEASLPPNRDNPSVGPRRVACIALLGDGDFVFLQLDKGETFFVRLTPDGEFDFSRGPHSVSSGPGPLARPLRDNQGGLWLTVSARDSSGRINGVAVRRITAPDQGQDFKDVGKVELVDASGCVWLAPRMRSEGHRLTIWSPSGETSLLDIPGRTVDSPLAAGPKGRVFARTAMGLQECVAKDPAKPGTYSLGTAYRLEPEGVGLGNMQYSGLGYLVAVGTRFDGGPIEGALHLFPLGRARPKSGDTPSSKDP